MTDNYIIETGIPIPKTNMKRQTQTTGKNIEILRKMRPIRDSLFLPGASTQIASNRFSTAARRNGMQLVIRKVSGGARIWRIN